MNPGDGQAGFIARLQAQLLDSTVRLQPELYRVESRSVKEAEEVMA